MYAWLQPADECLNEQSSHSMKSSVLTHVVFDIECIGNCTSVHKPNSVCKVSMDNIYAIASRNFTALQASRSKPPFFVHTVSLCEVCHTVSLCELCWDCKACLHHKRQSDQVTKVKRGYEPMFCSGS